MGQSRYGICGKVHKNSNNCRTPELFPSSSQKLTITSHIRQLGTRSDFHLFCHINCFNVFAPHSVNDVCIHPNQGELISCDQAGSIKQWDLSDNICSHELVSMRVFCFLANTMSRSQPCLEYARLQQETFPSGQLLLRPTVLAWSQETTK